MSLISRPKGKPAGAKGGHLRARDPVLREHRVLCDDPLVEYRDTDNAIDARLMQLDDERASLLEELIPLRAKVHLGATIAEKQQELAASRATLRGLEASLRAYREARTLKQVSGASAFSRYVARFRNPEMLFPAAMLVFLGGTMSALGIAHYEEAAAILLGGVPVLALGVYFGGQARYGWPDLM